MKIIGIVSEYNPFHNGHAYQVRKSIQDLGADGVVAIMSGNFVQRGYPALFDKWLRAEMAVKAGVNLVIELPTYYATSSAESFARGAIELLNAMGVITHLSFGSELDNLELLDRLASTLINPSSDFNENLSASLKLGDSYPVARSKALHKTLPNLHQEIDLNQSNVILGIEYLKALKQLDSKIIPFLVKRIGKNYNDTSLDSEYVSATAIRKAFFETKISTDRQSMSDQESVLNLKQFIPEAVVETIEQTKYSASQMDDFTEMLLYAIRSASPYELSQIREVGEGLENKLFKAGMSELTYPGIVQAIKSKRYTMTRINRILLNTILNIKNEKFTLENHGYFRVLAFDSTGQKIIREIKKVGYHPIITNINKHTDLLKSNSMLQLDVKATNIYHLVQQNNQHRLGGRDFLQMPYKHDTI